MLLSLEGCDFSPRSKVSRDPSGPQLLVPISYSSVIQGAAFTVHHLAAPMLVPSAHSRGRLAAPDLNSSLHAAGSGQCLQGLVVFIKLCQEQSLSILGTHRPLPCPDPIMVPDWSSPPSVSLLPPAGFHHLPESFVMVESPSSDPAVTPTRSQIRAQQWKHRVLTKRPPEKSLKLLFEKHQ